MPGISGLINPNPVGTEKLPDFPEPPDKVWQLFEKFGVKNEMRKWIDDIKEYEKRKASRRR